ncbi:hypothetical protein GX645_04855 [Candidatus Sumerlaeota bacterium]|nr:nitroreductase family protein [Candidatus Sumerlaeales bacterium]NLD61762.1 hypothetical protein [Candidatus Sumerlaeota bacterium]
MTEPLNIFYSRHSYRGAFSDKEVTRDILKQIVDAGLAAPSGCNKQTTSFVVIDDKVIVEKIRQRHQTNKAVQTAQAFICCIIDKNPPPAYHEFSFAVEDCAAATENMLLCISSLGLGSVWIDGWLRLDNNSEVIGQYINLPTEKQIRILLPIGYPAEPITAREKLPFDDRAWFNSYPEADK